MARFKSYDPKSSEKFRISRTKVDLFLNCERCFYLDVRLSVKRPAGFPFNLNSAVDALLKKEFDAYRVQGKPHPYMLKYGINAIPYQHSDLETWRSNFKGVSFYDETTNFEAFGAVDDLWIDNETKEIIVVDYKATSKADEVTLDADWQIGYKRQMEFYQWLLRNSGLEVSKQGWFVYCNGIKDKPGFYGNLEFSVKLIPYIGDSSWVTPTMHRIKDCIDSEKIPTNALECPYCKYALEYQIYNKQNKTIDN